MLELAPLLVSALILGLLGGGHCLGMCGGLMGALTLAIPKEQRSRRFRLLLAYNLGRILSYATAGLLIGLAGWAVANSPAAMLMRILAGIDTEIDGRVHFVEPQPHHLLSTYYRAADAVLVPSRSESFGLVALEAAACGIPVVASAVGGLLNLVEHQRTGFLVKDRNPDEFAKYVDLLLADPLLSLTIGNRAAQRAKNYSWSATADSVIGVYQSLLASQLVNCS